MEHWLLLGIVVFIASTLQAGTGFGFSIVAVPLFLFIYPIYTAVQLNVILSLLLSGFMILRIAKEVDKVLLKRLVQSSTFGLPIGMVVYLFLAKDGFKAVVGVFILFLAVALLFRLKVRQTKKRDNITGALSGGLTTSIGVPGPPLLIYFTSTETGKEVLRSTTLAYYLFVYFISLVLQVSLGGTGGKVWVLSLIAVPFLFAGAVLGQFLFQRISLKMFRVITYIILIFSGLNLLLTGF